MSLTSTIQVQVDNLANLEANDDASGVGNSIPKAKANWDNFIDSVRGSASAAGKLRRHENARNVSGWVMELRNLARALHTFEWGYRQFPLQSYFQNEWTARYSANCSKLVENILNPNNPNYDTATKEAAYLKSHVGGVELILNELSLVTSQITRCTDMIDALKDGKTLLSSVNKNLGNAQAAAGILENRMNDRVTALKAIIAIVEGDGYNGAWVDPTPPSSDDDEEEENEESDG